MSKKEIKPMHVKYETLSDIKFKEAAGIPRALYELLVACLAQKRREQHKKGGRNPDLCVRDELLMTLKYYRDYPTFFSLGLIFDLNKSNVQRSIVKVENLIFDVFEAIMRITVQSEQINIEGDKLTFDEKIVDVTECTIQRPKNKEVQLLYYSGKKKKHTIKMQIIIEETTGKIVSIAFDAGSVHDFSLFKKTTKDLDNLIAFLADSGYQGIDKIFEQSLTPKKKSKLHPLTDQDKDLNHLISSIRISIEHVNSQLKIFRLLSERYRSKIKTFSLRAIIICYFYNYCL